jgi:16S rRNA (guanine527-N7)-methyltransferase
MEDFILNNFSGLSADQIKKISALENLYSEWNAKINVISRKDMDNFYAHHVLHSMLIAKVISFVPGTKIMDLGTGGGFPGIPLAILFPETKFLLVDSTNKKLIVAQSIADEIGLDNVQTMHARAEDISDSFDFVVSRAVTKLDVAWDWAQKNISKINKNELPNGLLYLKGGDLSAELPKKVSIKKWNLSAFTKVPYFEEKSLVLITDQILKN